MVDCLIVECKECSRRTPIRRDEEFVCMYCESKEIGRVLDVTGYSFNQETDSSGTVQAVLEEINPEEIHRTERPHEKRCGMCDRPFTPKERNDVVCHTCARTRF